MISRFGPAMSKVNVDNQRFKNSKHGHYLRIICMGILRRNYMLVKGNFGTKYVQYLK